MPTCLLTTASKLALCRAIEDIAKLGPLAKLYDYDLVISPRDTVTLVARLGDRPMNSLAIAMPAGPTVSDLLSLFRDDVLHHVIDAVKSCVESGLCIDPLEIASIRAAAAEVRSALISIANLHEFLRISEERRRAPLAHFRQRLNALPDIQVLGLSFIDGDVELCLEMDDLTRAEKLVDLTRRTVTARNIAGQFGLRDMAQSFSTLMEHAAEMSLTDFAAEASRLAAHFFHEAHRYPLSTHQPFE